MKNFPAFFLLLFVHFIYGQDYSYIDNKVKNYPSTFNKIETIANKINYDFQLDEEKIRAIYTWLSHNISYDLQNDMFNISDNIIIYSSLDDKKRQLRRKKLNKLKNVLKSRKAVCIDYSELFKEICDRIGIQSEIVIGYSKASIYDIERENKIKNHAWNVVKIKNDWKIIDITWATAYTNIGAQKNLEKFYDYYFFTNPEDFILTHYPVNTKWQLVKNKISKKDFFKNPIFYPSYFRNKIKIADVQKGILEANKKRLIIIFNKIPKRKKFFYALKGDKFIKPVVFKKTKEGQYITSIKYNKSNDSEIIIYSDLTPVIGFKVKVLSY